MDENHRKFHAGRYTDRPEGTEWRQRDSYRKAVEDNASAAKKRAKVVKPVEHPDKAVLDPYEQYTKRTDM